MKLLSAFCFSLLTTVQLAAQTYPDNIFPDTTFAPFLFGVASGDPLQNKVIIWTKVQPISDVQEVQWQISSDSSFHEILQTGKLIAERDHDYCVKQDVGGLQPGHRYFYRFISGDGRISQVGIAQTLPGDSVKQFKLAVVSCSSIWAGYFNAYGRIAEREDVDFVIHLGDYAYNYPDERQLNRIPGLQDNKVASLKEWRARHTLYLLDPDLRAARQNKTWIAIWDNHDTDIEPPGKTEDAIQAFYEYLPIRMPDANHPENIYRRFQFGALADLNMIDMQLFRGKEDYAPGKKSVLGIEQDAWFKNNLKYSPTQWHLVGNQEMMSDWLSEGAPKFISGKRGNGRVFDPSNWSGFPEDRQRLFDFIDTNHIKNIVVLTGDVHMSFVMNLTGTPKDKALYNKRTGEGSVGVEITGPSISRINMKEAGIPAGFIPLIQRISKNLNPHHHWVQFTKHGYFTIDVTPERCLAEYWYVSIKKQTDDESFGRGFTVREGVNHWEIKSARKPERN